MRTAFWLLEETFTFSLRKWLQKLCRANKIALSSLKLEFFFLSRSSCKLTDWTLPSHITWNPYPVSLARHNKLLSNTFTILRIARPLNASICRIQNLTSSKNSLDTYNRSEHELLIWTHKYIFLVRIQVTLPMVKVKEITKSANACYVRSSYIGKIKQETIQNSFGFPNLFLWYNKNGLNGIHTNPEAFSNLYWLPTRFLVVSLPAGIAQIRLDWINMNG